MPSHESALGHFKVIITKIQPLVLTFVAVKTAIRLILFLTLSFNTAATYAGIEAMNTVNSIDKPWDVQLFPNPSNGRFQVKTLGAVGNISMNVFNVIGEKVFETLIRPISTSEVDLAHLSKGLYVVQFRNADTGTAITRRLFLE